jgi:hypothetical protein
VKQLNLNVTPEFERDLKLFMKRKGIKRKSDAIRCAIREAASRTTVPKTDFRSWIGVAAQDPPNPSLRGASRPEGTHAPGSKSPPRTSFRSLLGIGIKVPMNPNPRFTTEDQLWEEDVE